MPRSGISPLPFGKKAAPTCFVKKLLSFCKVALGMLLQGKNVWYTGHSKRVDAHFYIKGGMIHERS